MNKSKQLTIIGIGWLCFLLASCCSPEAVVEVNPYLKHYIASAPDSTNTGKVQALPSQAEEVNKQRLDDTVNPGKGESWGDVLRNIAMYYHWFH